MSDNYSSDGPTMPFGMDMNDNPDFLEEHPKDKGNMSGWHDRLKEMAEQYQDSEVKYKLFDLSIKGDVEELETLMTRIIRQDAELREEQRFPGQDTMYVMINWIEHPDDMPRGSGTGRKVEGGRDAVEEDDEDESIQTPYDHFFRENDHEPPDHGSTIGDITDIIEQQVEYEKEKQESKEAKKEESEDE